MRTLLALALAILATPAPSPAGLRHDGYGLLVMAHGGNDEWNATVGDALEPLRRETPVALALGMADAVSLEAAVRSLEAEGVERIGVVRLFISGDSWLERTEQILGLREGAPAKPVGAGPGDCDSAEHDSHGADCPDSGHSMAFYRIPTSARFALSLEGLSEAPEAARVLLDRALALSEDPAREELLVLAHGVGDARGNAVWQERIEARTARIRERVPFRRIHVETLAEDWPEARAAAEERVREIVRRAAGDGGRAIVIPFRLSGFGPYAAVLEGMDYVADCQGLLPHPAVTDWIRRQSESLRAGDFRAPAPETG